MRTPPIDVVCQHCGKTKALPACLVRKGYGKYCDQKCYMASRWASGGKCRYCGKRCRLRYCSPKCCESFWNRNGYRVHKLRRNWQRKLALIDALGGKCVRCGVSDIRVLDIDHIDPTKKVQPKKWEYSWSRRFADWAANTGNLQLLCANCHRLRTWEQRGLGGEFVGAILKEREAI